MLTVSARSTSTAMTGPRRVYDVYSDLFTYQAVGRAAAPATALQL